MTVKFMSPEQIVANQKNARKSTGPRTPEGKQASSRNGIKHGLLARDVVLSGPNAAEDRADFDALLADLCDELQPRGFIEQALVERIATCYWRLHRVQPSRVHRRLMHRLSIACLPSPTSNQSSSKPASRVTLADLSADQ